ncbi:hypothetical protein [Burkholderia contaminans]|uniref:hypothetical protein n=1 Tax=Burkholderia contaminans TaxID=488447 RepID=UPI00158E4867|nr:hypothetical protein [Burkholderia contaminans]
MSKNNQHAKSLQIQSNEFDFFKKQEKEKQEQSKKKETFKERLKPLIDQIDWMAIKVAGVVLAGALSISLIAPVVESMFFQAEIIVDGDWNAFHWSMEDAPKYKLLEAIRKNDNAKVLELWKKNKQVLSYSLDSDNQTIKKAILRATANDKKLNDFKQLLVDFQMVDGKGKAVLSIYPFADISVINEHIVDSLLYSELEMAAYNGQMETVKYLIGSFDSVYVPTAILPIVIERRNMELAKTLFAMGATAEMVGDHTSANLVREDNLPLIKLLVDHGYDIHADKDYAKRTAMLVGKKEIADYIESVPIVSKKDK